MTVLALKYIFGGRVNKGICELESSGVKETEDISIIKYYIEMKDR